MINKIYKIPFETELPIYELSNTPYIAMRIDKLIDNSYAVIVSGDSNQFEIDCNNFIELSADYRGVVTKIVYPNIEGENGIERMSNI